MSSLIQTGRGMQCDKHVSYVQLENVFGALCEEISEHACGPRHGGSAESFSNSGCLDRQSAASFLVFLSTYQCCVHNTMTGVVVGRYTNLCMV